VKYIVRCWCVAKRDKRFQHALIACCIQARGNERSGWVDKNVKGDKLTDGEEKMGEKVSEQCAIGTS
jgi:hypothetical protein